MLAQLWESEYDRKGIPSSFRGEPSGSLTDSLAILYGLGFAGGTAVDIGCGAGRNSLYLASRGFEVYSVDMTASVVGPFAAHVVAAGLDRQVHVSCQSVAEPWPIPDGRC